MFHLENLAYLVCLINTNSLRMCTEILFSTPGTVPGYFQDVLNKNGGILQTVAGIPNGSLFDRLSTHIYKL